MNPLERPLWPSLLFSLEIATCSTLLVMLLGVPAAFWFARKRFWGKSLIEAVFILPLVLPPTVVGFFLIVLMGRNGWVGHWLARLSGGYTILFRPEGGMLAAAIVSLPLLYLPTKAAFGSVEREMEEVATLMGAGPVQIFWHVSIPMARRGILSGLLLAFARALGEFGATTMVLGAFPDHSTLPIAIYNDWVDGELGHALPAVWALTAISLGVVLIYNRWARN